MGLRHRTWNVKDRAYLLQIEGDLCPHRNRQTQRHHEQKKTVQPTIDQYLLQFLSEQVISRSVQLFLQELQGYVGGLDDDLLFQEKVTAVIKQPETHRDNVKEEREQ